MEALVVIGALLLFGLFISFIVSVLNRKNIRSTEIAQDVVRKNLIGMVGRQSLDIFLRDTLPGENVRQGRFLLYKIAEVMEVPVESLLFDGVLNDFLVARNISTPAGEIDRLDPFAYDINSVLEKHVDWKEFERKMNSTQTTIPVGDDVFCDFFMNMTMWEFIALFAPLVKL